MVSSLCTVSMIERRLRVFVDRGKKIEEVRETYRRLADAGKHKFAHSLHVNTPFMLLGHDHVAGKGITFRLCKTRMMSMNEGQALVEELDCGYFDVCAVTGVGIHHAISHLVRSMR